MTRRPGPAGFVGNQDGGATAFGILALCLTAMLIGLAIDVTNLYRHETMMRTTADAASHAGAVALLRGEDPLDAARAMVARNMPEARFGPMLDATGLQVLHLDPATNRLSHADAEDAPANAVLVRLQRSAGVQNLLPTFLLGLVGVDGWTVETRSVAALLPTRRCGNADGFFARGAITPGPGLQIEDSVCLHSQTGIDLPPGTVLGKDLRFSLPDPDGCEGACPAAGPGSLAAMNVSMPDHASNVLRLADAFARPDVASPEETAFFADRPLKGDLEALAEVGVAKTGLQTGFVVDVPPFMFGAMRERPEGLAYRVSCGVSLRTAEGMPARIPGMSIELTGFEGQVTVKNLALITDCPIRMDALTRIEGSLIIQLPPDLQPGQGALNIAPGARFGDPARACDASARSVLMVPESLDLPGGATYSGLAVVVGRNVTLAADPDGRAIRHLGLAIQAGGQITTSGAHRLAPCPGAASPILPELRIISHVMPPLDGWLAPTARPAPETEMPGDKVKALPRIGMTREDS